MRQYIIYILLALGLTAGAQPIGEDVARERATALCEALAPQMAACRARNVSGRDVPGNSVEAAAPKPSRWTLAAQNEAAYLFTAGGVFVLTAADRRLPALLGYGAEPMALSGKAADNIPPALCNLLPQYARLLRARDASGLSANARPPMSVRRQALPAGEGSGGGSSASARVLPLLTTLRHQSAPYNALCPYYTNSDGTVSRERCVVGCVATALEQILTFYRRNYVLLDTLHGRTAEHFSVPDAMPGEAVDSRLILDDYDTENYTPAEAEAVARLSLWLGMAARMNWGTGESGASSRNCIEPLRRAFGMGYAFYARSYQYAPADWEGMVRHELLAGRPVYYASSVMRLGGHAFVLDGMDDAGLYHVNWGYGGSYDGYFDLAALYYAEPAPDTASDALAFGFSCNHEAIFLHPDPLDVAHPDTLQRTGTELEAVAFSLGAEPMMTAYTPATITLRNTSDHAVSTPLAFFTNLPADTAAIVDGDYVAYLGTTLAAGEQRTYPLHFRFDAGGLRYLRFTSDDEHYATLDTFSIKPYAYVDLDVSAPARTDLPEGVRFVSLLRNPSGGTRAGKIMTYQLYPSDDERFGVRDHARYIYLAPREELSDTVVFRGLEDGREYVLTVRCNWQVKQRLTFIYAPPTGITRPCAEAADEVWHTLDGRRVTRPVARGIYIKGRRRVLR